jgi:O-antigen ligase
VNSTTDFKIAAALLAMTMAVGGAGLSFPGFEMLLEISAIGVAAYLVLTPRRWRFPGLYGFGLVIVALALLLPLLQLVPLPPSVWQSLPGRSVPTQVDALLGWSRWRPLTLDVEATLRAFLGLLPAAAIFLICLFLRRPERARLLWVVLAFALIGGILGIIQLASGGRMTPFQSAHTGYAVGLFVNRNHSAALALVAMPIAAAIGALQITRGKPRLPFIAMTISAIVVFAVVVLGTTSRMGLALLPIALAISLVLLLWRRSLRAFALPSIAAVAALAIFIFAGGGFDRTLSRFSSLDDPRFNYWSDIQWALQQYGLAGTGLGTFIPVYQSAESLDAVVPAITNHAHNDYLEIVLDGGWPAIVILVLFFAFLGLALFRMVRDREELLDPAISVAAITGVAILLASSSVDYPLRMPALAGVLALLCTLLLPSRSSRSKAVRVVAEPQERQRGGPTHTLLRGAALAILGGVTVLATQAGVSARHLLARHYDAAVEWAPWSTEARERRSTALLLLNRPSEALPDALAAIALSPISVPAIRTVGLARLAGGSVDQGNRLLGLAVVLGWRDTLTQLWAIEVAKSSGESEKVLQRAEALFRQHLLVAPTAVQLLQSPVDGRLVALLIDKLAERPDWRDRFFDAGRKIPMSAVAGFDQVITGLGRTRAPVSLDEAQPLLDNLVARGRVEEAQRIWARLHNGRLIANGGFDALEKRTTRSHPKYWNVYTRNASRVLVSEPDFSPSNPALRISGQQDSTILSQDVLLTPGAYVLRYRISSENGADRKIRWELQCRGSGAEQGSDAGIPPGRGWHSMAIVFNVPQQGCAAQRLALEGVRADVWLDDIELHRIAP